MYIRFMIDNSECMIYKLYNNQSYIYIQYHYYNCIAVFPLRYLSSSNWNRGLPPLFLSLTWKNA